MYQGVDGAQVESRQIMSSQIASDEEWEEWLKFLDEYNAKKKEKQEKSLLYWIYKRLKHQSE